MQGHGSYFQRASTVQSWIDWGNARRDGIHYWMEVGQEGGAEAYRCAWEVVNAEQLAAFYAEEHEERALFEF